MRKKKYIVPRLECLLLEEGMSILAGTTERETGPESPEISGPGGKEEGRAKQNPFSSWENWDEY